MRLYIIPTVLHNTGSTYRTCITVLSAWITLLHVHHLFIDTKRVIQEINGGRKFCSPMKVGKCFEYASFDL